MPATHRSKNRGISLKNFGAVVSALGPRPTCLRSEETKMTVLDGLLKTENKYKCGTEVNPVKNLHFWTN